MDLSAEQQQALDRALHFHNSGNLGEAEKLYRGLLEEHPEQADALHYLGVIGLQVGQLDEAVNLIQRAVDARPEYLDAVINLGYGLNTLGRHDAAIEQFERALKLAPATAPGLTKVRQSLADALMKTGRVDDAIRCVSQLLEEQPDMTQTRSNLANVLRRAGRFSEAIEHYEKLLEQDPDNIEGHYKLGVVFQDLGEKDKAQAAFRNAVKLDASFANAWHGISAVSKDAFDKKEVKALLELQQATGTSVDDRTRLAFALGKHFENSGRHEDAASQYLMGNRLKRSGFDYDIDNDLRAMKNLRTRFDRAFLDTWRTTGLPDRKPIFIVGMPRSGTTLIEQVLASHPGVFGAGELSLLVHSIIDTFPLNDTVDYTSALADVSGGDFEAVAKQYLDGLPDIDADRITDKLPHNFLNVGMIRIVFPNATIVHCRRDPRDTCFSIYKHLFGAESHYYAYELGELARYHNGYAELMDHWEQVMPGAIHSVEYEAMIDNQEQTTRELLDACGLEWDPACLEFHKYERPIATISASQVRQPLYRGSIGAWQPYEKALEPLLGILNQGRL